MGFVPYPFLCFLLGRRLSRDMTRRNERDTENIVRKFLAEDGDCIVSEQIPTDATMRDCLQEASKQGGKGVGKPEFLLSTADLSDFVVVIECKADPAFHETERKDNARDYACDGALHYARHLSSAFNVVAVGVSGVTLEELKVSAFIWPKGAPEWRLAEDRDGPITTWKSYDSLHRAFEFDPDASQQSVEELLRYSKTLHNEMRDYAKLSEQEKPLLVAAVLLALQHRPFKKSYAELTADELPQAVYDGLCRTIDKAKMPDEKGNLMKQPFLFIVSHQPLQVLAAGQQKSILQKIVADIDREVSPFSTEEIDVLGQFYGEFLRYTGGDKKGLGIVLTPRHIADLFAQLANVGPNDTVLDPCAGTGGFLLAAMSTMLNKATTCEQKQEIRQTRLIGIEQQPTMFALAASNMMLHGDGRANLRLGSCFDSSITNAIKSPLLREDEDPSPRTKRAKRPNVGFINPPFAPKGDGLGELSFIENMLDCLEPGGTGIAIVPMSCASASEAKKKKLLEKHTLVAVMSMPDQLFVLAGTVTCIMVFRAHQPHSQSPVGTWFGYWKDDGFIKMKNRGRVDSGSWDEIRQTWISAYNARSVEAGSSVVHTVTDKDEWCAEAYLETDYSQIDRAAFEEAVREHLLCVALLKLGTKSAEETQPDELESELS